MNSPRKPSTVINCPNDGLSDITSDAKGLVDSELIDKTRSRRTFLKSALRTSVACAPLLSSAPLMSKALKADAEIMEAASESTAIDSSEAKQGTDRILRLWNVHTGEHYEGPFWSHGSFVAAALDQISFLLRDHRIEEARPIDPLVIDFIHAVYSQLQTEEPIQILSGYRSPQTNASLAKRSNGVAKNSLHMLGKAIDFRLPDHNAKTLRKLAINTRRGGVGFYPEKDFIYLC